MAERLDLLNDPLIKFTIKCDCNERQFYLLHLIQVFFKKSILCIMKKEMGGGVVILLGGVL